ncbi:MAG: hypothetical protein LLG09_02665 [Negativicutes bacterium]|nr:hypothetical protein [Negativicutes bacterium]
MTDYFAAIEPDLRLQQAKAFFQNAQRTCCPKSFPDFMPRHPLLQQISGVHAIPSPMMPFWWSEGILNSPQLQKTPWIKELLQTVTWQEMMEGKISENRFKQFRAKWTLEQRKLISSPKIGGILNVVFVLDPEPVKKYRNSSKNLSRLPWWWYWAALESRSITSHQISRFLANTTVAEFNRGEFQIERLEALQAKSEKKLPKTNKIEEFLFQVFYEYPNVLTKYNQRGGKTLNIMRVATDPYSIVTMSTRSPHWSSCQNPIRLDTHELSHKLWANLLDSNMAILEMINPEEDEETSLVARAILRIVRDHKQDLLYLDCLYGERGYITSFVNLTKELAKSIGLVPVSGRMLPFYTSFNTPLSGYSMDFKEYEPPYLDFGEWRKQNGLYTFIGEGHYLYTT